MGRSWVSDDVLYEHRVTAYLESVRSSPRSYAASHRQNVGGEWAATTSLPVSIRRPRKRTLLFEVHQDTVPVETMTIDPFAGEIRGGKLYKCQWLLRREGEHGRHAFRVRAARERKPQVLAT